MGPISFVHGKDAVFKLDDSGGTLRTLTTYVTDVSGLPGGRELGDTTAMGATGKSFIPGLQDITFSISGHFDSTATTGPHTVLNGLRTATATASFEYGPEGGASGKVKILGECWLKEYAADAAVGDVVDFKATFQVDGAVTTSTF